MKKKVAGISVIVNLFLSTVKIILGVVTHSISVLAEGINSGMDVFSSMVIFIGIRLSEKPHDKEHPYGHHKYEVLSGLVIALLVLITGIYISYSAVHDFFNPSEIEVGILAISVMAISMIVNEIMARVKIHYGRKEDSISLVSDGIHSRVDVYTSLSVLVGLILIKLTGILQLDAILAFLIGLYVIKESFFLGKEAVNSLLDSSAGEEIETQIKSIAEKQNLSLTEIRTQKRGAAIAANLEIELSGKLSVKESTKISKTFKKILLSKINRLEYVAIQIKSK